jgi:hypothetical protein
VGRSTIFRLRHIVLLVYGPSSRKLYKNWLPGTTGMKHWDMSAISVTICYKPRKYRYRNASCDYRYTNSSGKQEVAVELYWILRELL